MKATVFTALGGFSGGGLDEQLTDATNTNDSKQIDSSRIERLMADVSLEHYLEFRLQTIMAFTEESPARSRNSKRFNRFRVTL
jgi:hypothetical protein